jgi:MFS family permease
MLRWGLLVVLAGTMLIDAVEVSVMIVALPTISRSLGLSPATAQWLIAGFAVGFGGLLLFGVRLVRLFGRRRVYLCALVAFALACVVGAVAGPEMLMATRFVRGCCAALTAPTGLAIIMTAFPEGRERDRALSVYTLAGAAGFTAGLVLSGLLTTLGWRWVVVFPAPLVLALFVLGLVAVPADPPARPAGGADAAGACCLCGFLASVVYGIVTVPAWFGAAALVLAALLLAAFVLVERSAAEPLVRLDVLRNGSLLRAMLGAAALNGSYLGLLIVATVRLQEVAGWSPLWAALALLPASVPLAVVAPVAGRLVRKFGTERLIALGAVAPPVGYALYLRLPPHVDYVTDALPTLLLVGIGFLFGFTALNAQATTAVPTADRPMAGGLYQTAVQAAAAVMTAAVTALLAGPAGERAALWLVTAVGLVGLAAGGWGLIAAARTGRSTPVELLSE